MLLLLDFQAGLADQSWSAEAVAAAQRALTAARQWGIPVVFSRVAFLPGYADIAASSKAFVPYKQQNLLPPEASKIVGALAPHDAETVVAKNRFSPYAGSPLRAVLDALQASHLVFAGVTTGGVVLGAFTEGETTDRRMTILSDACADSDPALHDALVQRLFPRSAEVTTVADWSAMWANAMQPR